MVRRNLESLEAPEDYSWRADVQPYEPGLAPAVGAVAAMKVEHTRNAEIGSPFDSGLPGEPTDVNRKYGSMHAGLRPHSRISSYNRDDVPT